MREFVFGTDKQFEELDGLLQDNQCHVYNGCIFRKNWNAALLIRRIT